jgi:hypothetical protein
MGGARVRIADREDHRALPHPSAAAEVNLHFHAMFAARVLLMSQVDRIRGTGEMKLGPEERIIAAALDQAALNQANERGAGARIEFSRDGHAGLPDNRVGLTARGVDYGSTFDHPAPGP